MSGHNAKDLPCEHCNVIGASKVDIEEEADKIWVIEMADTVIDPRAMMVLGKEERKCQDRNR